MTTVGRSTDTTTSATGMIPVTNPATERLAGIGAQVALVNTANGLDGE